MKISMLMTEDAMQVNLIPETQHEGTFTAMLRKVGGPVTVHHGIEVEHCRGGWLREWGEPDNGVAIHIANKPPNPVAPPAAPDLRALMLEAAETIAAIRHGDCDDIVASDQDLAARLRAAAGR